MKITFVYPAIGKKSGEKYIYTWKMEPLTIAMLKALTPQSVETEFFDDRIELINYETKTDLVVITVETYTAKRSYFIASEFMKRGIKVILGGYHVTLLPEEAKQYADCIVTGNAEGVWSEMLKDFSNHQLKPRYSGHTGFDFTRPDKTIFQGKKYVPVTLVEIGRGCCHNCEFCAITSYYHGKYHCRRSEDIIEDLKESKHRYSFFVDDNLIADKNNASRLFQAVQPYKKKWAGQGTLAMAKDKEFLRNMKKSGCDIMLIGFESLEEQSLVQMNKTWSMTLGERDELVERIHDAGISIYATFVFGFDGDTKETFEKTLEFARKHKFFTAAFNHLLPFPGTPLYERLKAEDRLIYDQWWLEDNYNYGELAFKPKNMSPEELAVLCRWARKEYANLHTVSGRGFSLMKRDFNPFLWGMYWAMNLRLGEEIDEKLNIPIGRGLDELPK
ncbi:MAG: radical protein [Clostridia bacterium]|jgi:radical SAM superfamily enzyme YgiQ (UPF0313 family)|nr:radical protein [Clostridia bacterium]